jgi:hypothetical protein
MVIGFGMRCVAKRFGSIVYVPLREDVLIANRHC